ncbi:MAG: hypothetical protein R3B13_20655 [Polyangiaceae bacterium]
MTLGYQPSAISHQPSAISHQPSAISHQQSAISNQQSAISNQLSAISYQRRSRGQLKLRELCAFPALAFAPPSGSLIADRQRYNAESCET